MSAILPQAPIAPPDRPPLILNYVIPAAAEALRHRAEPYTNLERRMKK